jgi:hypothetical protein
MLRYPQFKRAAHFGYRFYPTTPVMVLPQKQIFCLGWPTKLGPRPIESLQCNNYPPLSVAYIKASIRTESGSLPASNNLCIANITSSLHPLITGGPYLVEPDSLGQVTVAVKNCAPTDLELNRNDFVGSIENIENCETREINPAYLQSIAEQRATARPRQILTTKKREFIESTIKLNVP